MHTYLADTALADTALADTALCAYLKPSNIFEGGAFKNIAVLLKVSIVCINAYDFLDCLLIMSNMIN